MSFFCYNEFVNWRDTHNKNVINKIRRNIINNNGKLSIKLVNKNGDYIGMTYPKRVEGFIKKNMGEYVDYKTFCLYKVKGLNKISIPKYTLTEELINAISHGIGCLLSIAMLVLCIIYSKSSYAVVASCIYGSTSIILYLMSTLYHSLKVNKAKKVFRILDHTSIYLLIAGTYTPYTLVTLREAIPWVGWLVFGIIWACAILGIVLTAIDMNKYKVFGMILYMIMGWMIIFTFKILINNMNKIGIIFMLIAGIVYTIGAILFGLGKKIKYMHSIFHILDVIASVLFFFSIFFYVI